LEAILERKADFESRHRELTWGYLTRFYAKIEDLTACRDKILAVCLNVQNGIGNQDVEFESGRVFSRVSFCGPAASHTDAKYA
jgi:hypothetical protein